MGSDLQGNECDAGAGALGAWNEPGKSILEHCKNGTESGLRVKGKLDVDAVFEAPASD